MKAYIDSTGDYVIADSFNGLSDEIRGYIAIGCPYYVYPEKAQALGLRYNDETTAWHLAFYRIKEEEILTMPKEKFEKLLKLKRDMERSLEGPTEKAIKNISLTPGLHPETLELLKLAHEAQRTGKMPDLSGLSKAIQ